MAKGVFAERGYHVANVAHICEAARIGRGTLYQYFENKRDVLRAVVEDVVRRVAAVVEGRPKVAAIPGLGKAPPEMIRAFCEGQLRELLEAVYRDEATLRLVLREARGTADGIVDELLARIDGFVLGAVEADIGAARAAGLIRAEVDPRLAALHIVGGVEKVVLAALAGDGSRRASGPLNLEGIIRGVVDVQLFGVLGEEARRS